MVQLKAETAIPFLRDPIRLYIAGEFVASEEVLETFNPATGRALAQVPVASPRQVDEAVSAAHDAFVEWRSLAPTRRARLLWALAEAVDEHLEELAVLEVLDNGKPIGEARAVDIPLTAELLRYYAGWTTKITGDVLPNSIPGMLTLNKREPVGVVAALAPWNFPLLELCYKLGPALAAGCTVVAKPSEMTPLTALQLAQLAHEIGFPPGVINVLNGGPEVGAALVRHPGVNKVAFTGQPTTGQEILRASIDDLKLVSLSLGAKSPNIIFDDADIEAALAGAFGGIFFNQGEACVAGSRLLVHTAVAQDVAKELGKRASAIRLGDGLDPHTEMGPLISASHRERVLGYVRSACEEGAQVIAGGDVASVAELDGYFMEPTVLLDVQPGMRVAREEVFGPVLSIISWSSEEELVSLANDSPYGLAAGIWTRNTAKALRIADRLDAGTVWINTYGMFDVAVPFGGRKLSGHGRELGEEALASYLQWKSVWVDLDPQASSSGQSISR